MEDTINDVPDSPDAFGQVEAEDGTAEVQEDAPVLDVDQFGDHYVTVKVDGEEVRVPLAEAVAGYQRQADYTRKTQALATQKQDLQWAQAIRSALENDPASTIDLLSEHYGISRKAATQMAEDDFGYGTSEWDDPVEKRLREIDQRVASFEAAQAEARLHAEIQRLQNHYGEDFDPYEVVAAAAAQGSTNLEAVYKQIAFDRVTARATAAQQAAAAKSEKTVAAKRAASVVSGGSSASSRASDDVGPIRSIADAWAAAKRQYGA